MTRSALRLPKPNIEFSEPATESDEPSIRGDFQLSSMNLRIEVWSVTEWSTWFSVRCWSAREGRVWLMVLCLQWLRRSGRPVFPGVLAGIDAGKGHHWIAVVDEAGVRRWSRKVENDESAILDALAEILPLAQTVHWAVDISGTASTLLPALLAAHGQQAVYVPGRTVNRMSGAYRGEAKTDERDAYVIAESARHRRDFTAIDVPAQLAADLALLVWHRKDLVADRVRMVNRLRDALTGIFPALERAFDYSGQHGALVLMTGYQTPAALRRIGQARLERWLAKRGVRSAGQVADTAVQAAHAQHTTLPGEAVAAETVAGLAAQLLALDERIGRIDKQITGVFRTHPRASIIESMPGIGPILGAELLVAAGDFTDYSDAGHLASAACLAPFPRDSGIADADTVEGVIGRRGRGVRLLQRVDQRDDAVLLVGRVGTTGVAVLVCGLLHEGDGQQVVVVDRLVEVRQVALVVGLAVVADLRHRFRRDVVHVGRRSVVLERVVVRRVVRDRGADVGVPLATDGLAGRGGWFGRAEAALEPAPVTFLALSRSPMFFPVSTRWSLLLAQSSKPGSGSPMTVPIYRCR